MGVELWNYTNECTYYPFRNLITLYNMLKWLNIYLFFRLPYIYTV